MKMSPSNFGLLIVLLATATCFMFVAAHSEPRHEPSKPDDVGDGAIEGEGKGENYPNEEDVNLKLYPEKMKERFEGDILLTPEQKAAMKGVQKRAVVRVSSNLWPNGVIPYVMDTSSSSSTRLFSSQISAINAAINYYHENTCIRFVRRTSQSNYVRFFREDGCYSYVGRTGGRQEISIGNGCQSLGIVLHEIFHALGRFHEHSRPDRDNFVTIIFDNIRNGFENQFTRLSTNMATTQGVPYDFGSIMHYSARAFSRNNEPTIRPRSSSVSLNSLGQRDDLSSRDIQHINRLYCNDLNQWSSWSSWSTCSEPCDGGTQTRTRTCRGTGCSGPSSQTRNCNTEACGLTEWSRWSRCSPSCGNNRQRTRTRTCIGPRDNCSGPFTSTRSCKDRTCSRRNGWGPWSSWQQSNCNGPCTSRSLEFRSRTCVNRSRGCPGRGFRSRPCPGCDEPQNNNRDSGADEPSSSG